MAVRKLHKNDLFHSIGKYVTSYSLILIQFLFFFFERRDHQLIDYRFEENRDNHEPDTSM